MERLCDMIDLSCKECPFGFLDADAGCPLYINKDFAKADIEDIAERFNKTLERLNK